MDKQRVAVYGSLRQGMGNHVLLEGATFIGFDTLNNYGMVSLGGFPAIDEAEGSEVVVEIYHVDDHTFKRLDRLEGTDPSKPIDNPDNFYSRREVTMSSGTTAWVYYIPGVFNEQYTDGMIESGDWCKYCGVSNDRRSEMCG